jgi:hypothetical protein
MNRREERVLARRDAMSVEIWTTDGANTALLKATELDRVAVMAAAETREDLAKTKGRDFMEGAIPFWAGELIKAIQAGKPDIDVHGAALNAAMAA